MKFMPYDEDKAESVCAALAGGELLIEYCPAPDDNFDATIDKAGRPRPIDVYQWLSDVPEFAAVYKVARLNQAMSMAERALVIMNGFVGTSVDATMAKGKSEALRWMASRMDRNTFGDQTNRVEPVHIVVNTTLGNEDTDTTIGQNMYKGQVEPEPKPEPDTPTD